MDRLLPPEAFDELLNDVKTAQREMKTGPLSEENMQLVTALLRRIGQEVHKATKTVLMMRSEKSVSAEKAYGEISALIAEAKQSLTNDTMVGELREKLDLIVPRMARLRALLRKSFEAPDPVVKRILMMREGRPSLKLRPSSRTVRVKRRGRYTQSKITAFLKR